jgi:hypothetical protein
MVALNLRERMVALIERERRTPQPDSRSHYGQGQPAD